ncbi:hypothetical protein M422DRAFT_270387 [Sphaerobolus stellatus SS14]|uniref:Unplaced genomic scaffold SPHSTscaffold_234, whole genome shotgun sequence n=1 Tax=Sphaerobolus stellatus (strain SS14) TaxID=990650 RepID=A0A0C9USJ7_SPHS4|nr:hypothetical protein M422DRAFT_270387 [Sphaerobolus stellatus SS14]
MSGEIQLQLAYGILCYVFLILGNITLFALLLTFWRVHSLSQRNNPFLINLLVTTWLSTFPACLLLFVGNFGTEELAPKVLCIIQAFLLDGVVPMFGMAMFCLVLHTWLQVRADMKGQLSPFTQFRWFRRLILGLPYFTFICWFGFSTGLGLSTPPKILVDLIWCAVITVLSNRIRRFVGFFMTVLVLLELLMEASIIYLVINSKKVSLMKNRNSLSIEPNLLLRIGVFTFIQLATLALTTILSVVRLGNDAPSITNVYRIVESLDALCTFLVFGMSNGLLEVWRLKRPTSVQSDFREVERGWDQDLNLNAETLDNLPDIEAVPRGNSRNSY